LRRKVQRIGPGLRRKLHVDFRENPFYAVG
jgi:hypothetical protein